MSERTHDCLDGNLPVSELTTRERWKLRQIETALSESLEFVREAPVPDMVEATMARIRERETHRLTHASPQTRGVAAWKRMLRVVWSPRTVRVRPVWAVAVLTLLALGITGLSQRGGGGAGVAGLPDLYVRFELLAPQASSVSLAGTFTDWKPRYQLSRTAAGHWTALVPLRPGVHEYAFVVDGEHWMADPGAPSIQDGFGGVNSQISLLAPQPRI